MPLLLRVDFIFMITHRTVVQQEQKEEEAALSTP